MKKFITFVAAGFGLGYSPVASGTVGSLPGVFIGLALMPLGVVWHTVVAVLLCLLAIPICEVAERQYLEKDDGRIVADEYLTFPLCLIGLPMTPWVIAMAFVICRILDIIKPWPARQLQNVPGGLGVALDDIFASAYALALSHLAYRLVSAWLL